MINRSTRGPAQTSPCGSGGNVTMVKLVVRPNSAGGVRGPNGGEFRRHVNFAPGTYFFYNATISFGGTVTPPAQAH